MKREIAFEIVNKHVKNPGLIKHMLAVEASMRFYAKKFGADEELWGVVGLLHDFDWEIHPDKERHPTEGAKMLREMGVDELIIRAILSHANYTGVSRDSQMEKTLFAVDELTGLITACTLVRPNKNIHELTLESVKNKWANKNFARGVNREDIENGAKDLEIELDTHITNVLSAMQEIASDLGLAG